MHDIWTEKYRPKTFAEVKGQQEVIKRVEALVKQKNLPHLMFAGPAGVGKTTLALVVAHQLYGKDWKEHVLELNASDERGIDVIRVKVKEFARTKAIEAVPFKIIYLDECDALTKEAQQALRRTMENYTQTCRFILSCNYSSKIIDPIQSRCMLFKFKPLSQEDIENVIDNIAKQEKLHMSKETKAALYEVTRGDCRRAENVLQGAAALSTTITEKEIYEVASVAKPKEIIDVLELAAKGRFLDAKQRLLDTMLKHGLGGLDVIKQMQQSAWQLSLSDHAKLELVMLCGEIEFRMVEGSDDFIQLETLLAKTALLKK
ncbi:MAG: replication factor C small subunit [archaeon]